MFPVLGGRARGVVVALLLVAGQVFGAGLRVKELRCESMTDPLAVEASRPRLSWKLESADRDQRQSAYQIQVASSGARLERGNGDFWDSGRVPSEAQHLVRYLGRGLHANDGCFWRVRVWDRAGRSSGWSPTARWRMGLLGPSDWPARWIGAGAAPVLPLPLFRREYTVRRPLRSAILHVSGLGHYEAFLDGRKVGDRFLDPAWSVYEKTVYYDSYDLTERLAAGTHAFGVMLGKGFYHTAGDRRVHGVDTRRPLKLILQLHLEYDDGSHEVVGTDEHWRTHPGPITHSAVLGGEDYDARQWPAGWNEAGFDDSGWSAAVVTDGPGGRLTASWGTPMSIQQEFRPVRTDEPEPGVFVYDFGQNASAIPRLHVQGHAGQVIRLTPAEQRFGMGPRRNDGRGLVNPAGVGRPNYWTYTLRGEAGGEAWRPQFAYSGFQYLQLDGGVPAGAPNPADAPVVETLTSLHVRNTAATVGHFECSNPLLNRIDRIIDWAVRANLAHVLTDCPHREKLGWLEVAYLMGPSIAGRYDLSRFYPKIAQDCRDSQATDGMVPTVAPSYPVFSGGFAYTPEWGAAAVVLPWQVYQWYGDRETLAANFQTMRGFVDFMHRTATNLVPRAGLGDWYDYGHGKPVGPSQFTPVELSAMATFQRCARIVADTAAVLRDTANAARYEALATRVADAFNQQFFDGRAEYRNAGSPQCANGLALVLGLAPNGTESALLDRVIEDIRQRGNQQTAGDIGHAYLLQALAQGGRSDVIFDLVSRTNLGSYGFIVNNGWTSMPEAWDADTGASMNHCMLGHVQEWFLGWVAGIRPDAAAPGFARCVIAPEPVGDLTWARGSYDSVRGPVTVHWQRIGDRFRLHVSLPPNLTATVRLPARGAAEVTEGGQRPGGVRGVHSVREEPSHLVLEVGSGDYEFDSILPVPGTAK